MALGFGALSELPPASQPVAGLGLDLALMGNAASGSVGTVSAPIVSTLPTANDLLALSFGADGDPFDFAAPSASVNTLLLGYGADGAPLNFAPVISGATINLALTGNASNAVAGHTAPAGTTGSVTLTGNHATALAGTAGTSGLAGSGFALLESWKTYSTSADILRRWVYQLGNGGTLTPGGGSITINGSTVSYCNTHISPLQKFRMGFNFLAQSLAPSVSNSSFLHLLQGGETNTNNQIGLGLNPNGTLSVFYGQNFSGLGGTTLANGTTVLALNTNYWIEIDVQVATGTAGSVTVKINGVTEFALTGISTCATPYAWISGVSIVAGAGTVHVFGSMYIGDGSRGWIGPANVSRILLTADTVQKDFIPSTGSANWSLLNTINDTANVSSSSLSATDIYTLAAVTPTPLSIAAVQVEAEALQTNSANLINALLPVVRQGGISAGRGAIRPPAALPASWSTAPRGIYDVAPNTSPWTPASLAAARVGFRITPFSRGFNFRATAGYVTDKPSNTYVINDLYPTTRGGATFGWDVAGTGTVVFDRTTAEDVYAGINCQINSGAQRTFRVDVPAPGRYQIRMIAGDASFAHHQIYVQVKDGTTPLFTLDSTTMSPDNFVPAVGSALDASGTANFSLTAWDEYNAAREVTLAGTVLNITIGSPAAGLDYSCLAHLEIVALDYTAALATQAPTVQVANLYVEALIPLTAGPMVGNATTGVAGTIATKRDITLAGNAATGHPGTVSVGSGLNVTLTGNAAAGHPGTIATKRDITLAGAGAAGHPGTILSGTTVTVSLAGNTAAGHPGTIAATAGVVVALAGNAAAGHPGTLTASAAIGLIGDATTGHPGTIAPTSAIALVGNATAGHPGTMTTANEASLALMGNAANGRRGALTAGATHALNGNAAAGYPGTATAKLGVALQGSAAAAGAGRLTTQRGISVRGNAGTGHAGNLYFVNGQGASLDSDISTVVTTGIMSIATDLGLAGNAAAGDAGVLGTGQPVLGNAAAGAFGTLGYNISIGLRGNAATGRAGHQQIFIAQGTYVFVRTAASRCFVRQGIQAGLFIRSQQSAAFTRGQQPSVFTRSE